MYQKIVDIHTFQKDSGLDDSTLKELYLSLTEELKQEQEEIKLYLKADNRKELTAVVHKIKGIASSYRTPFIYNNAVKLESHLKSKQPAYLNELIDALNKSINQAVELITLYFET